MGLLQDGILQHPEIITGEDGGVHYVFEGSDNELNALELDEDSGPLQLDDLNPEEGGQEDGEVMDLESDDIQLELPGIDLSTDLQTWVNVLPYRELTTCDIF